MAAFTKLQTLYPKVHFDLSRKSSSIILRGKPEAVALVKDSILGINVEMETMKLAGRETALIVGKGGVTVNQLVDEYNVAIDVSKEKDDTSVVKIVGTSMNVASAKAAIQVEKATGEIKILGEEKATMAIKNAFDDIVANNQIVNVAVDESMLGLVFGQQGKEPNNYTNEVTYQV